MEKIVVHAERLIQASLDESLTAVVYELLTSDPWQTDIRQVPGAKGRFTHHITSPDGTVVTTELAIQRTSQSIKIAYSTSHEQGRFTGTIRLTSQPDGTEPTRLQIRAAVVPTGKTVRGARPSQASYAGLIRGVADRIKSCATLMTSTPGSNLRSEVLHQATRVVHLTRALPQREGMEIG